MQEICDARVGCTSHVRSPPALRNDSCVVHPHYAMIACGRRSIVLWAYSCAGGHLPSLQFWVIQTLNSLALGALLFLLAAGFSLIFGLMRIANLTHGALFMLGAYLGVSVMRVYPNLWVAALIAAAAVAVFGGLLERFILRKLGGNVLGQVLVTLGVAFILADLCLVVWGGDPIPVPTPAFLQQPLRVAGIAFPAYRLAVVVIAIVVAIVL